MNSDINTDEAIAYAKNKHPKLVRKQTREMFRPENVKKNNKVAPVQSLISAYKFAFAAKSTTSSDF